MASISVSGSAGKKSWRNYLTSQKKVYLIKDAEKNQGWNIRQLAEQF